MAAHPDHATAERAALGRRNEISLMESAVARAQERVWRRLRDAGYTDITPSHFVAVRYLARHPDGVRITRIAAAAGLTKQSAGYLVDQLETGHYIRREADSKDGRAQRIVLAPRGHAAFEEAGAELAQIRATTTARFGERRMAQFREVLEALSGPAFWEDDTAEPISVRVLFGGRLAK